jgi:hypothetical protein
MKCRRLESRFSLRGAWHRRWCGECRAAQSVDARIARGVAQIKAEPVSMSGLEKTLAELDLPAPAASSSRPVGRRGWAPLTTRRALIGVGLGMAAVLIALAFPGRSQTAVLAETLAAMERASSFHFKETGYGLDGRVVHSETWYANGRTRLDGAEEVVIDDGRESRTYRRGSRVVKVDHSVRERVEPLGAPGQFLRQTLADKRSYNPAVRVEEQTLTDSHGRRVSRYKIYTPQKGAMPADYPYTDSRFILWVDLKSHLPTRWEEWVKRRHDGRWQLNSQVSQIEFDVPIPDQVFRNPLPSSMPLVEFDMRKRAEGNLVSEITRAAQIITLRTLYLSEEGDVILAFAPWGEAKARVNPDLPGEIRKFGDDRGMEYAPMREVLFRQGSSVETRFTPLKPRRAGAPWPRKFHFTLRLKDGEEVFFHDVPAPAPPYVSAREIPDYWFTNGKPVGYLEEKRQKARAEYLQQSARPA